METLKLILTILYVLVCIALVVVVLMQESKGEGLSGAINGTQTSYWGKNKGRSAEGILFKLTVILSTCFIVISLVLCMGFWNK